MRLVYFNLFEYGGTMPKLGKVLSVFVLSLSLLLVGCETKNHYSDHPSHLTLLTGTENKPVEQFLLDGAKKNNIDLVIQYRGSIGIMEALQGDTHDFDVVWPSQRLYINLGDEGHKSVKEVAQVYTTYLCIGIRKSAVGTWGLTGNEISTEQLRTLVGKGFKYGMTNLTNSNSGLMAYVGILYAVSGQPRVLENSHLQNPELGLKVKEIFSGVNLRAGTNGELVERFGASESTGLITYESALLQYNSDQVAKGLEPVQIFYLTDCPPAVDAPMGFVDHGVKGKFDTFKKFQQFVLSKEATDKFTSLGFRSGFGGKPAGSDVSLFKSEWGVDLNYSPKTVTPPTLETLKASINAYITQFGKPSYVAIAADYSGSMGSGSEGTGLHDLREGMRLMTDKQLSEQNKLALSPASHILFLPFADGIKERVELSSADQGALNTLWTKVMSVPPGGGTNIYGTGIEAIKSLRSVSNLDHFIPSIVLMTDGQHTSMGTLDDLIAAWKIASVDWKAKGINVPIYTIGFGSADEEVLKKIAAATDGLYFDGRKDLVGAFRKVWGNQ